MVVQVDADDGDLEWFRLIDGYIAEGDKRRRKVTLMIMLSLHKKKKITKCCLLLLCDLKRPEMYIDILSLYVPIILFRWRTRSDKRDFIEEYAVDKIFVKSAS